MKYIMSCEDQKRKQCERIFRTAAEIDFERVKNLYWTLIDKMQEEPSFPKWSKDGHPSNQYLKDCIRAKRLYIAEACGTLLGCVAADYEAAAEYEDARWMTDVGKEEVMVLHILAVAPEQRGKGVGKFLVEQIINLARKEGAKTVRIDVISNNVSAQQFYKKTGFCYVQDKWMDYGLDGLEKAALYEFVL